MMVYSESCVHMCMYKRVHVRAAGQQQLFVCRSQSLSTVFFEVVSLTEIGVRFTGLAGWISDLHLSTAGITHLGRCLWLFPRVLGIPTRVLMLV